MRAALAATGDEHDRRLHGLHDSLPLAALRDRSVPAHRLGDVAGRSVLLAVADQLTAALALIALDGVARRITLCPPDLPPAQLPAIARNAPAQVVICERDADLPEIGGMDHVIRCAASLDRDIGPSSAALSSEWILLTSGTTGLPKLVRHTLASLLAPIKPAPARGEPVVWSTFYDIRCYGGLQIFLRAIVGGGSLVLSNAAEATGAFLGRAGACGVTHISGTPSHWRRALMSPQAQRIRPRYVRLSGEIADQALLDQLRQSYAPAGVGHAFASTEAGVAFEVERAHGGVRHRRRPFGQ